MEQNEEQNEALTQRWQKSQRRGKIAGGLLVVAAGSLFLARELGTEIPQWIFTWKTALIAFALMMFAKHGFRRPGWIIPLLIGGAFLLSDLNPDLAIKPILWPVLIIMVGLFIIFKPQRKYSHHQWRRWQSRRAHDYCYNENVKGTNENFLDSTSVMGGVKKNILSKEFKGGDITNVFGGTELNLMQADFEGIIKIEVTQVFGGTKLIVPANWQIQATDLVTVFGSLEDKRPVVPNTGNDTNKVLILTGVTFFGGIDIKSY